MNNFPDSITATQYIRLLDIHKFDPEYDDKMSLEEFEDFTKCCASPYDGNCSVLINGKNTNIIIPCWGSEFGIKEPIYLPIEWLKNFSNEDFKVEILWFNK